MAFLYEKIDALREYGSSAVLPSYIPENRCLRNATSRINTAF
jgi:hypothetical protein